MIVKIYRIPQFFATLPNHNISHGVDQLFDAKVVGVAVLIEAINTQRLGKFRQPVWLIVLEWAQINAEENKNASFNFSSAKITL